VTVDPGERRLELTVRGRVQGVGFRMFALDRARALGLRGWVANQAGGAVGIVAEGPEDALLRLLAAAREGPPGSRIDHVAEAWSASTGAFDGFSIKSGWHAGD
jgi:acylphosphatase